MQVIIGKFIKSLPTIEGDNARSHWVRGGFVIEYEDRWYTELRCFSISQPQQH